MTTKLCLSLLHLFFAATASAVGAGKSAVGNGGSANFILTSCNATRYPHLCYTSLSRYADAVQQSPRHLARVAVSVSLTNAQRTASYVSNLRREAGHGGHSRSAAALRHCLSNLDDAVDHIRESLQQMQKVGSVGAAADTDLFVFQMSNVKTWMSSALTDADTCTDGFREVPDGLVKADVRRRVAKVKKLTSNALALVNSYADKGMP